MMKTSHNRQSLFLAFVACAWLACVLLLSPDAQAADPSQTVRIEISKGAYVRLPEAARSVVVADPDTADAQVMSPRVLFIHAKKIGDTTVFAIDASDNIVFNATIQVTHNISKLERMVKETMPNADVTFETVDGGMMVKGYVDSMQESSEIASLAQSFLGKEEKLVNLITTAGSDQVTLMVKIAEVSRNELKRFGIHMESLVNAGNFSFQVLQGRDIINSSSAVTRNANDNSLFGSYTNGNYTLRNIVDALETQGLVSVLAEPNLTTTSGKAAEFLAGGEFPIPITGSDGTVDVDYKPYGIGLKFTPAVMSEGKISLTVEPEVSTISSVDSLTLGSTTQFTIPSLQTRRAKTTVELGSGQTFAIAGLLKNDRSNNVNKFPGLGNLPVLGALFRSYEFQNDQSELVILVTPYIARPISKQQDVASPLDGYTPATDLQTILLGKLYDAQPSAGGDNTAPKTMPDNVPALHGSGGFILE